MVHKETDFVDNVSETSVIEKMFQSLELSNETIDSLKKTIPVEIQKDFSKLDLKEIKKIVDVLRYIYAAQNIRNEGVLISNCGDQESIVDLKLLGFIRKNDWKPFRKEELLKTTQLGESVCHLIFRDLVKKESLFNLHPIASLIFSSGNDRWELEFHGLPYINKWESINKLGFDRILKSNIKAFEICDEIFQYFLKDGLCVVANYYVSTKGDEIRNKYYILSPELRKFLMSNTNNINLEYTNKIQELYSNVDRRALALGFFNNYSIDKFEGFGKFQAVHEEIISYFEKLKCCVKSIRDIKDSTTFSIGKPFSIENKKLYDIKIDEFYSELNNEIHNELTQLISENIESSPVQNISEKKVKNDFKEITPPQTVTQVQTDKTPILTEKFSTQPLSDFITFPTASDESKTNNVLGRNQYLEKFVLGIDEENRYITIPWNGNESHISLFCGTGTGKSTLVSSIALQSIFQRIPVVIFDPKDGWGISLIKSLNDILNSLDDNKKKSIQNRFELTNQSMNGFDFSKPIIFDLDGKEYKIKYNIFSFDENVIQKIPGARDYKTPLLNIPNVYPFPEKTDDENKNRFKDACDMVATSFVEALNIRGEIAYNSEISYILQEYRDSEKSFFTRNEFIDILSNHDPKMIDKKDMKKLNQGISKYCTANAKFIARDDESVVPVETIFNNPFIEENDTISISIFDIQSIGAMAEQDKTKIMTMYSSSVTGQIFDYINKKNPPVGEGFKIGMPKVWLIYDEAHNLIEEGKTTSNNNIKRIMQEGRSLGAFATIISQKPQNVDITARAQAKNRIYSEVTWESINRDLNVTDETKLMIKEKVRKSTKSTKMMTLVNDEYPEGKLIYPLSSPQCILAKTDMMNLF